MSHRKISRSSTITFVAQTFAAADRPSLRFHLREQTAASHARLDENVGLFDSVQDYIRYCRALLRFRAPLEKAIANAIPGGTDNWRPLPLADLLQADLADLGCPVKADVDPDPYRLEGGRLLGALYVLEGSSLGAQILVLRAAALGFSETSGARHLALQTRDPKRWSRFVKILDRDGAHDPQAVVAGAQEAFSRALQTFLKTRHEH